MLSIRKANQVQRKDEITETEMNKITNSIRLIYYKLLKHEK